MRRAAAIVALVLGGAALAAQAPAPGGGPPTFAEFLAGMRIEAASRGISPATIDAAFGGLEPLEVVVERDRTQAEAVLTIDQYVQRRLTPAVVRTARSMRATHDRLLRRVRDRYDVPERVLVAVWGLESNFGRFSGVRPTVQALATLAWDGRRASLFTGELLDALAILDHGDIPLADMKGSWAGAMGQVQFMPSSYLKHAQDFDGDGRRDIWGSVPDVFASIANYLKAYGWRAGQLWGREVRVPGGKADALVDTVGRRDTGCRAERELSRRLPLAKWQALGVRTAAGRALPSADREASLLSSGRTAYLVYGNYESLLGYNCAHAYALAVAQLSDRIGR